MGALYLIQGWEGYIYEASSCYCGPTKCREIHFF